MMRQRVTGRPHAHHQHLAPGRRFRHRTVQVQRIPARQQTINLKSPRQRQHVLQGTGLGLRNINRLLLLIDAGFHAIVADPVTGTGAHRIIQGNHGQTAHGDTLRFEFMKLRNAFFQRTTRQQCTQFAALERGWLIRRLGFLYQSLGARVLALLMAPDAVIGFIERTHQIGAVIGQCKPVAFTQMPKPVHRITSRIVRLQRQQMLKIQLCG